MYTGLPLYHSSGQWFAMGAAMYGGFTAVLRKRFSASKFWQDCVKYDATIMHHIGECCRFLLGMYLSQFYLSRIDRLHSVIFF